MNQNTEKFILVFSLSLIGLLILASIAHGFESKGVKTFTVSVDLTDVKVSTETVTSSGTVKADTTPFYKEGE